MNTAKPHCSQPVQEQIMQSCSKVDQLTAPQPHTARIGFVLTDLHICMRVHHPQSVTWWICCHLKNEMKLFFPFVCLNHYKCSGWIKRLQATIKRSFRVATVDSVSKHKMKVFPFAHARAHSRATPLDAHQDPLIGDKALLKVAEDTAKAANQQTGVISLRTSELWRRRKLLELFLSY